jgi:serine/threonine-protein kinase
MGGADISKLALDGSQKPEPVVATAATEGSGQISPDGRWLLFDSDVSGRTEVWVRPFAGAGGAMRQVSRDGGQESRWSRDGKELYYFAPGGSGIMAVTVNGDSFSAPRLLFEGRYRMASNSNTNYDVARDGRLLMVQPIQPTKPQTRIEVVLNGLTGSK